MYAFKWLGLIVFVVLVGLGARSIAPKAKTAWFLRRENEALRREVREIQRARQASAERLRRLSVPRFIEQAARVRLQLRRPGEEVVVIVSKEEASATTTPKKPDSIWKFWQGLKEAFGIGQ